ncbi:terminase small subunit [Skermanella mucosa]|uniref:terminase small subunit n=1 Tax=Skermanella mucosa TaxID=1789672 RepID=UPI00192C8445|nr:terminase small subunit [Skermanella mucosa]UEM23807.1 terminase small subunit [Skermanella mucosa]
MNAPAPQLAIRQELFCEAIAAGASAAEAARKAGYSPKGAKQRGHFLLGKEEIRVRIDRLRADRRAFHQARLDKAAEMMETIIADAMEAKKPGIAMRGVEFQLKLLGVIQDRRISHHFHGERDVADADIEAMTPDPVEWMDAVPPAPVEPASVQPATVPAAPEPEIEAPVVTKDDLSPASEDDPAPAPSPVLPPGLIEAFKAGLPPDFLEDLPADLLDDLPDEIAGLSWTELAARISQVEAASGA